MSWPAATARRVTSSTVPPRCSLEQLASHACAASELTSGSASACPPPPSSTTPLTHAHSHALPMNTSATVAAVRSASACVIKGGA